jgi:hypothetical protein
VSIISSFEERRFATKILVVGAALPHQRPHRLRVPAMGSYEERRFGIIVGKLTSAQLCVFFKDFNINFFAMRLRLCAVKEFRMQ